MTPARRRRMAGRLRPASCEGQVASVRTTVKPGRREREPLAVRKRSSYCLDTGAISGEPKSAGTEGAPSPLLHIFDLTAIGLVVTNKEGLKGRRKLLSVEVALLIRLHIRRAFPQTYRKPGILILPILQK